MGRVTPWLPTSVPVFGLAPEHPLHLERCQGFGMLCEPINWLLKGYEAINKPEFVKKAFALCAVPEFEFNLSYESLTSRSARQALLDLRTTNPDVYRDITSGHPLPSGPITDEELEFPEDDGLYDGTVDEAYAAVLIAHSSGEATRSARVEDNESESEYECESEDNQAPAVLGPKIKSRGHNEMDWEG
ncbi:hypothetical protein RSAG8_08770, partial [Rhizoctonia solani AG-8 WAC10335]